VAEGSGIWVPPGGSADSPRPEPQPTPPGEPAISPDELVEQLKRLRISDLLLSSMSTIAQLAYAKLEPATRDLEQARLAIEALRALVPVLEGAAPEEALRDFRQVISNLQLAYATSVPAATAE
jgi:hypothetical protein